MKKMLRVLLIAALCLMLAVPAFAEPKVFNGGLKDVRMVTGTNLYTQVTGNGNVLYDLSGHALTGEGYGAMTLNSGYLHTYRYDVEGLNSYGILDQKGNTVVPFAYNILENDEYWAVGIALTEAGADSYDYTNYSKDAFYNIANVGIYYLPDGKCVAELTRDQYVEHRFVNGCINIADRSTGVVTTYGAGFTALGTVADLYAEDLAPAPITTYRENGRYGLKDTAGNVVMEPSFQSISNSRGYFIVYNGEKSGLVDSQGNLVVEAKYDKIISMSALPNRGSSYMGYCALNQYYCISENDKIGFVDAAGNVTFAPKYGKNNVTVHGASYSLEDLEGNIIICTAQGGETVISGYERVNVLDYTAGVYYKVTDGNNMYGLIDWNGNVVLPCEYNYIYASGDGQYVMVSKDFDMFDILMLEYPETGAAPAEQPVEAPAEQSAEAPAEQPAEAPAEQSAAQQGGNPLMNALMGMASGNGQSAAEQPAEAPAEQPAEAPVEQAAGDNSAVHGLLTSALTLLSGDAAGNSAAIISLLQNAAGMVDNADAAGLLNSAVTLLNTDAAANSAAATALINSAIALIP